MSVAMTLAKTPLHTLLRRAAALVLAIGMLTAAAVWATSKNESNATGETITATGSSAVNPNQMTQREEYEIEKFGGKPAVYVAKFDRWLSSLFHGKNLAGLIAVLTLLISLGCWREAHWQRLQTTSNP
jgi:hypothetical protein